MAKGMKPNPLKSAGERGSEGRSPPRGGSGPFEGFKEGSHGRGSTPYTKSQSASPGTLAQHGATSGRGGDGRHGGPEGNKGRMSDISHPQSHAEFENLGR